MTQALVCAGHEARLAYPYPGGRPPDLDWSELKRHYGLRLEFPVAGLAAAPALRRYDYGLRSVLWARRWGAELIYTRLPQAAAAASLLGLPVILEVHDLPQGQAGPLVFRLFLRGRGARRLVVISRLLAEDLNQRLGAPQPEDSPRSFTVIAPDGVDLERYAAVPSPAEARRRFDWLPDRFTVGYTGHLYPGRGSGLLLDLAKILPEINFLLTGGEPQDVERLRRSGNESKLDNIYLTGFIANAELPAYQAACDLLLMPYQQRVAASSGGDIARYLSPMKVFEYLACGRPILSSDLPVLREVLNNENAILLPPDDPSAWAGAIRNLQADPGLRQRMAERARLSAGQYAWEQRAKQILTGLR